MHKWIVRLCGFVALMALCGIVATLAWPAPAADTAIQDYTSEQRIVDGYLGGRESAPGRIAAERRRLDQVAALHATGVAKAFVVFARPVQGTEIEDLVATFNLTLTSFEVSGTGRLSQIHTERIDRSCLEAVGGAVARQVNTCVRELGERILARCLASTERDPASSAHLLMWASSPDFGIYRANMAARTIDFQAALKNPAVAVIILSPRAGDDWKRLR